MEGSPPIDSRMIDGLAVQFLETSLYTEVRNLLYEKRAVPPIDFLQKSIDALQLKGTKKSILEVGCGKGGFALKLDEHNSLGGLDYSGEMTSTDVSSSTFRGAADRLKGKPNFKFAQADARNLPFRENSFDVYVCRNILNHVGDPLAVINDAKRVTVPGGTLSFEIRGIKNFPKHAESVDKVLEYLGFEPVGSPYASFDSEAALGILGEHFEIVPELSYPQEPDDSSVREVRLRTEDWDFYKLSLYGTILAAIMAQRGDRINIFEDSEALPPEYKGIVRGIKEAIDMLVWPDYEAETNSQGYYRETAQVRLITCINTKEDQPLAA